MNSATPELTYRYLPVPLAERLLDMALQGDQGRRLILAWRRDIWLRDGGVCGICYGSVAWKDLHIDHVVSVRDGGRAIVGNLRTTHLICNQARKRGRDYHYYQSEIVCQECGARVVGVIPIQRYCDAACRMKAYRHRRPPPARGAPGGGPDG